MKGNWKRVMALLLALALVTTLGWGCGGGKGGGKVTITIGEITDFTGPAAPAVTTIHYALEDVIRYYNENGLIPGVKMKLASWDTHYDASREVPGYDWVRSRGAKLVVTVYGESGEILKPFADRDKVVVTNMSATTAQIEPPGWVFCFNCPASWGAKVTMKWVSENHWDYSEGIPKFGFAGWNSAYTLDIKKGMEEYCQAHPDKFEWVGSFLAPMGEMSMSGLAEKLKDCDYVACFGTPLAYFLKAYRDKGYTATVIDSCSALAFKGFLVDMIGWQGLDGTLSTNPAPLWNEPFPLVELAEELLQKYRSGQANDIIAEGAGYVGVVVQLVAMFNILTEAVTAVGAENFDGQAYYDAAVNYKTSGPLWEGYPQWGFSETKRWLVDDFVLYKFDAKTKSLVRLGDWLHNLE